MVTESGDSHLAKRPAVYHTYHSQDHSTTELVQCLRSARSPFRVLIAHSGPRLIAPGQRLIINAFPFRLSHSLWIVQSNQLKRN